MKDKPLHKSIDLIVGLILFLNGYFYTSILSINSSLTSLSLNVSDWLELDVYQEYIHYFQTVQMNSVDIFDNVLMVIGALWIGIGGMSWAIEHAYFPLCKSLLYFVTSIAITCMGGYFTYFIVQFWWQAPVSSLFKVYLLGSTLLASVLMLLLPVFVGIGMLGRFRQVRTGNTLQK